MSNITLELIANGPAQQDEIAVHSYVHKRLEEFVYYTKVTDSSVALDYVQSNELDSWDNLQIANRTYRLPENSPKSIGDRNQYESINGDSYVSRYQNISATNVTAIDANGITRPLFWAHSLPKGTSEASIYFTEGGNRVPLDSGYKVDLEQGYIYSNFTNYFDPDTGSYRLYYVLSTDSDGVSTVQLLASEPVAKEATWEDIDLSTGTLLSDKPRYSVEETPSGYIFNFSSHDDWHIKTIGTSLIQPKRPSAKGPTEPWYPRFSSTTIKARANGEIKKYWIPEWHTQPFAPYKPYVYSLNNELLWVNKNTIATSRGNLKIDPSLGMHLTLLIYDSAGALIRVLSTDVSQHNKRHANTGVFVESDKILGWDNFSGFIATSIDLLPSWQYEAFYFFESIDFEYKLVDLNPINNPKAKNLLWVFYLIPDMDEDSRALHHIAVDESGKIVETSQGPDGSYPNLKLLNSDGSFNEETIVGVTYYSELSDDSFYNKFCLGGQNDKAYYVLAEISFVETTSLEDLMYFDVRKAGGTIKPSRWEEVYSANPRLLQSRIGYGDRGQPVPEQAIMVIDMPIDLLEEYGGTFTESELRTLAQNKIPAGVYPLIRFVYPKPNLSGYPTEDSIILNWKWCGPQYTYNIYKKENQLKGWDLLSTLTPSSEGGLSYTDIDIESESSYYYKVSVAIGNKEYPGETIKIRAKKWT